MPLLVNSIGTINWISLCAQKRQRGSSPDLSTLKEGIASASELAKDLRTASCPSGGQRKETTRADSIVSII